ncbi:MAG: translation initiation factor [Verrucomicrobiota bacterium]
MAKKSRQKNKVETRERVSAPLQSDAFSALDTLDVSVLPSGQTEEEKRAELDAAIPWPKDKAPAIPDSRGRVVLRRETKRRGGKAVVIVSGFRDLPEFNAVRIGELAKQLRGMLGVGGSFDRHEILLQGDKPAHVAEILRRLGFRVEGVTE